MWGTIALHGVVVGGGVVAFLPYFQLTTSNLDTVHGVGYAPSGGGTWFHAAALVALTLAVPMLLDLLADLGTGHRGKGQEDDAHVDIVSDTEKLLLSLGFAVFPMVAFFPSNVPHLALLTVCANRAQCMVVGGTMFTSFLRQSRWRVPTPFAAALLLVFVAATVLGGYAGNAAAAVADGTPYRAQPLFVADTVLLCVCGAALLAACVRWLRTLVGTTWVGAHRVNPAASVAAAQRRSVRGSLPSSNRGSGKRSAKNGALSGASGASDAYATSRIFFAVAVVAWLAIRVAGAVLNSDPWEFLGDNALFLALVPTIVFELAVLLISLRVVKHQAISSLLLLLRAKAEYVRYISHELRTPLNAAHSGIQLLYADLAEAVSEVDKDRFDTLNDIALSISTTVDILNDLLTFEKMEAGLMELHKSDVNVISFVESCVGIFYSPARNKNIDLSVETSNPAVPGSVAVLETDLIRLDKFKCSQVLRNFLSNACKFTPDNGAIVVRICFVPSSTVAPDDGNNSVGHDAAAAAAAPVSVSRRSVVSFMGSMLDTARGSAGRASVRHGATPRLSTRRRAQNVGESHASASSGAALPAGTVRGTLHIHVTDSGAGISEENQKKLFNEIVQFNPEKLQGGGGSGFGLFICKGIVDLHNGQLRVISDGEGTGSTFALELPMRRAPREVREAAAPMLSLMSSSRAAGISKIRSQHYGSIRIVPSSGSAQHRNSVALSPPGSASHPVPRLNLNLNLNLRPQANDASASFAGGDTRAGPEGVFSDDGIRPAAQVASSSRSNTNPAAAAALMSMKEQVNKSGAADSTEQPAGLKHVDAPPSGPAGAEEPPAVPGSAVAAEPAPGMLDSVREQTVHCHSESTRPQSKADGGEQFTPRGGRRNRPEQSGATAAALKKHTNTHSYRILLVDDSPLNLKMLGKLLKAVGHRCEEAKDGSVAVDMVKANLAAGGPVYDVILMDFVMPVMNGPTATKKIRELKYDGKIFGVTGNGMASDIKMFLDAGADRVLCKPLDVEDLHSAMAGTAVMGAIDADDA